MPVVINEIEVLDAPRSSPSPAAAAPTGRPIEPAHEQLRRLSRDLETRRRRLIAD
jgi:hypothetical protein